jgi:hypothetical protein
LPDNAGNPFVVGDFATIEGAQPSGINTVHQLVTATTESTITLSTNTSSIVGIITTTNASIARSVKVASLADGASTNLNITEVVQLVSE